MKKLIVLLLPLVFANVCYAKMPDCWPDNIYVVVQNVQTCNITDKPVNGLYRLTRDIDWHAWSYTLLSEDYSSTRACGPYSVTDTGIGILVIWHQVEPESYSTIWISGSAGLAYYFDGIVNYSGYADNRMTQCACSCPWCAGINGNVIIYQDTACEGGPFANFCNFIDYAFLTQYVIPLEIVADFCRLWLHQGCCNE